MVDLNRIWNNATAAGGWGLDLLITIGASAAVMAVGAVVFGAPLNAGTLFVGIPAGITGAIIWRRQRRDNQG